MDANSKVVTRRWIVAAPIDAASAVELSSYPAILRQLLYNRGLRSAEAARRYINAEPPAEIEGRSLLGLEAAAARLSWAIDHGQPVAVYGDYDVDGVTATALLTQVLEGQGAQVMGYIPNRFEEGYGLNHEALRTLYGRGARLVVTVDCGIRSVDEAETARQLGLDLVISDHHQPSPQLPGCHAIINPHQPGDDYPDKGLAGVGLAYKLADALLKLRGAPPEAITATLDLVALGTVADLAPLTGENRALVRRGLAEIRRGRRQGLLSLIGAAGLSPEKIDATQIGFMLGPRLNAAGRLETAQAALDLLTSRDVTVTGRLAQQLDNQNRERQQITQQIQEMAGELAHAQDPAALLLFAVHPDFNPGVVGLAASRLVDRFYRPACVAQRGEVFTRGSCRSIPEFHITAALDACADLLEHHGGHAAAAGFTVRNENLPALVERMQAEAARQLTGMDLRPTLPADLELNLGDLNADLYKYLQTLQPTGQANPQPVFVARNVSVRSSRVMGKNNDHLKLSVSDRSRVIFDAVAFRQGHWFGRLPSEVDLMFNFEINEFNGRTSFQLNVRDLKPAGLPD